MTSLSPLILTLTPNAAIDRILFVDAIVPGTTMRCSDMVDHIGGKGLDSSIALHSLGIDTFAITFAGGLNGQIMIRAVEALGIPHEVLWLEGETRIAHVVVETQKNRHSHLIAGSLHTPPEAGTRFLERMAAHLPRAAWAIAGGSLPPGLPATFYAEIAAVARAGGVPLLVDTSGPPARALLADPPAILKMNRTEFEETFDVAHGDFDAFMRAALEAAQRHTLPALVLTAGEMGIVAITPAGAFHASCPPQAVLNAAGAGDAASAALTWRLALGDPWPLALQWAVAVSAGSVGTPLTGIVDPDAVARLFPQVMLVPLHL
jgi:1-phosphofructokinase family hexose kinase